MINTNKVRALALLPFVAVGARCAAPTTPHHTVKHVLFCEVGCKTFNVDPPTILDVWMNAGGSLDAVTVRCNDMGGHVVHSHTGVLVCGDVDY